MAAAEGHRPKGRDEQLAPPALPAYRPAMDTGRKQPVAKPMTPRLPPLRRVEGDRGTSIAPDSVVRGDCLKLMRRLASASVDFVLTDPPYLVGYVSRDGRRIEGDADGRWLEPAFAELYRVLRADSYCVSFYGWSQAHRFLRAWNRAGFRIASHFVWPKAYASGDGRLVRYRHEQAYLLVKGRPPRPSILLPDVLDWEYSGNLLHPTQKPVSALVPLVLAFSRPGDVVLDPFCGSGSSLVAAKVANRHYIGFELDERYARAATERLAAVRV
jgi:site-specific DNA-methyltransferase (adenine-specific)